MTNFHVEASVWEHGVSLVLACCGDCLFRAQKGTQQDSPAHKTWVEIQVQSDPNKESGHPHWLTRPALSTTISGGSRNGPSSLPLLMLPSSTTLHCQQPHQSGLQDLAALGLHAEVSLSSENGHCVLGCLPSHGQKILPTHHNLSPD